MLTKGLKLIPRALNLNGAFRVVSLFALCNGFIDIVDIITDFFAQ